MKTLVTMIMNAGNSKVDGVRKLLIDVALFTGQHVDVIYGQEFGDRDDLKNLLHHVGYQIVETKDPGSGSTPVFYYRKTMTLEESVWIQILGRIFAGPGAGPDWLKPKGLNMTHLRHKGSGRRLRVSSWHAPASQQFKRRHALARRAIPKILHVYSYRVIRMIGGDMNTKAAQYVGLVRMMTKAGWTNTDIAGGVKETHGHNLYDQLWWAKTRLVHFIDHWTFEFGSDHRAKVGKWRVKPTRKMRDK